MRSFNIGVKRILKVMLVHVTSCGKKYISANEFFLLIGTIIGSIIARKKTIYITCRVNCSVFLLCVLCWLCGMPSKSCTWDLHWGPDRAGQIAYASDAQLPPVVVAPALDPAPRHDCTRVAIASGHSDGKDAWQGAG